MNIISSHNYGVVYVPSHPNYSNVVIEYNNINFSGIELSCNYYGTTKIIDSVKEANYIYNGNTSGGPGEINCIKFGKSGNAGSLTFTTSANIGKIEFTYHPWSATKDTNIFIGERKIAHKANEGYSTPVVDSIAFESTKEITISTDTVGDPRACVLKLKLYVVAE